MVKLCAWGGGGGGAGVVYIARSCHHDCGIFSIGMSLPIHVRPNYISALNNDNVIVFISQERFVLAEYH